ARCLRPAWTLALARSRHKATRRATNQSSIHDGRAGAPGVAPAVEQGNVRLRTRQGDPDLHGRSHILWRGRGLSRPLRSRAARSPESQTQGRKRPFARLLFGDGQRPRTSRPPDAGMASRHGRDTQRARRRRQCLSSPAQAWPASARPTPGGPCGHNGNSGAFIMRSDPDFEALLRQLLDAGVAPKYLARLTAELEDHYDDLKHEACRVGVPQDDVAADARERLGRCDAIAFEFERHPELRSWI